MGDFLPDQAGSDERYHAKWIRTDRRSKEMRDKQKFIKRLENFELPGGDRFELTIAQLKAIHEGDADIFRKYCRFFDFGMIQGLRFAAAHPDKVREALEQVQG